VPRLPSTSSPKYAAHPSYPHPLRT
jgi:hypothetical protein